MAKTIGFWKNWASCAASSGKQQPILEQTLALGSILIGDLYMSTCPVAVDLLNKSAVKDPTHVGDGKKMASDPAFNLAAQLLAYRLNIQAGANGTCSAANTAAASAQNHLAALDFNGNAHGAISRTLAATLNSLEPAQLSPSSPSRQNPARQNPVRARLLP